MADSKPWPTIPTANKDLGEAAVVIIGGGISGMCTAIDLIQRHNHRNFIILEKSGGVGGTWRDNKYPGCCCDVWSHLYSYSFEQNSDWTREYPAQPEILRYLVDVAQKYQLYQYVRFNSTVEAANWDDVEKKWNIDVKVDGSKDSEFNSQYTIKSDFLVSAVGQLNQPKVPDIKGIDEYKGKLMHSARWDWSYDVRGKKVAIIGNGATAAQIIPELVREVKSLTIHQRTPNWVIPRLDVEIPEWKRAMYKYLPYVRQRKRSDMMDYREAFFHAVWDDQHPISKGLQGMAVDHMHAQLPDRSDLWEVLLPKYKIGCKRVIISDDYLPVFLRDNVKLETGTIDKITEKGIQTEGKEEEYDLIICATGFNTVEFMHPINITGSAGRTLQSVWKEGGEALYGITVESLPNFGMLYGPNTNLGHNSIVLMIEAQSRYITALIKEVLQARKTGGQLVIKPKESRVKQWNEEIQSELKDSSFNDPNCGSWYKRVDNGKITQNWSRTVIAYQKLLSEVNWNDYDVSGKGAEKLQEDGVVTKLGRVVEESLVSYQTMGITALSLAAIGAVVALRSGTGLRLR